MSWDYRQLCPWINWVEEGQGSEQGGNQYENCVPTAMLLCLNMLYKGDFAEPQDVTNAEYGSNYHGPEDFSTAWQYVTQHPEKWTSPPGVSGAFPNDPASWIEQQGEAHIPMVYYVHCDTQANIVAGGAYGHACVPIAGDGQTITLWANGFYGGIVNLSHADINAVNYGGATVFDRAIGGVHMLTTSEKREKVRTWFIAGLGREPDAGALDAFSGALHDDGSNAEELCLSVYDSGEAQNYRTRLASAGAGAPGPKGDRGPAGPQGPPGSTTLQRGSAFSATVS